MGLRRNVFQDNYLSKFQKVYLLKEFFYYPFDI